MKFTKMQGLGNDFVVIDATQQAFSLSSAEIQRMANRRYGIGFDQMLVIEPAASSVADFNFRIFNADGGEVEQCGNGARCVALYIQEHGLSDSAKLRLTTLGGLLELTTHADHKVTVNMGVPHFLPEKIPFVAGQPAKAYVVEVEGDSVELSVVNVGNPHAVIVVDRIDSAEVAELGERLSRHQRFPEGVNVGFMQVIDAQNIRLQVCERGAGPTLACGSGACAAMVIGRRNGLLHERVSVNQPGGSLVIDWQGPETPILMTGPAKQVFVGEWFG